MADFTIVIQGPQTADSISAGNAHRYLEIADVVVSCWDGDDVSGFDGLPVKIVSQPLPKASKAVNAQNIYYQCVSTLHGIRAATTPYAIKVRADEAYTDLTPIIHEVISNPERIVTNNIYARRDREWKFHPSDHVIAGKTSNMEGTFLVLKTALEEHAGEIAMGRPAEQRIFLSFLKHKNIPTDWAKSGETMKAWCRIVPASKLGSIIWSDAWGQHRTDTHYVKKIEDI